MEIIAKQPVRNVWNELEDIIVDIKWSHISEEYFGKSSTWLYQKLKGVDGNGGTGGFTADESEKLKGALCDFADRIRICADKL